MSPASSFQGERVAIPAYVEGRTFEMAFGEGSSDGEFLAYYLRAFASVDSQVFDASRGASLKSLEREYGSKVDTGATCCKFGYFIS